MSEYAHNIVVWRHTCQAATASSCEERGPSEHAEILGRHGRHVFRLGLPACVCVCVCVCMCICERMYVCMNMCTSYMYVCVYACVCIYVCVCMYMHKYICICIYIYTCSDAAVRHSQLVDLVAHLSAASLNHFLELLHFCGIQVALACAVEAAHHLCVCMHVCVYVCMCACVYV